MILPNFLIIGAAKAGTTSIAQYLDQHPDIFISSVKEPFFFAFKDKEIDFSGPGDSESLSLAVTNLAEYYELFNGGVGKTAIGEASTSYLYVPGTAEKIYHHIPSVKLVVILRNPVQTAYSSFLHQVREGFETETDFSEALKLESKRIDENWMYFWHYRKNGYYYQKLKIYYELFPREQIGVFLYSDFQADALSFIRSLFHFLEVDSNFTPDLSVRYNMSGVPRSRLLHNLTTKSKIVKRVFKPLVPKSLRQRFRKMNLEKPELSAHVKKKLLNEYQQDILMLEKLVCKDLSHWLA